MISLFSTAMVLVQRDARRLRLQVDVLNIELFRIENDQPLVLSQILCNFCELRAGIAISHQRGSKRTD
jgi:hypothetical protein